MAKKLKPTMAQGRAGHDHWLPETVETQKWDPPRTTAPFDNSLRVYRSWFGEKDTSRRFINLQLRHSNGYAICRLTLREARELGIMITSLLDVEYDRLGV